MLSKLHQHNGIIFTLFTRKACYLCVMPIQRYDFFRYSSYRGRSLINNLWGISILSLTEKGRSAEQTLEDSNGCLSCSTKLYTVMFSSSTIYRKCLESSSSSGPFHSNEPMRSFRNVPKGFGKVTCAIFTIGFVIAA